jgi:hypothetical protein
MRERMMRGRFAHRDHERGRGHQGDHRPEIPREDG